MRRSQQCSTAYTQTSRAHDAGPPRAAVEFAYVANQVPNNFSAYAINASTGALTQVTGSPFAAGYRPRPVVIDPTGKFAYVVNGGSISGKHSGNVSAYAINARTGALTQVKGSPLHAGRGPSAAAVDPAGEFAYVTDYEDDPYSISRILVYAINLRSGALTQVKGSRSRAGSGPDSLMIDRHGKFAYVVNYYSSDVSAYAINATTGGLTQMEGSPFGAGTDARGVAIDPSGKFAYVP